ncbi:hypothetical protein [Methanosarcina mazei]|uniref:Uncharacterized protein n=1 Tax=Methanosarcina mazei TaxID=2209 RepID=A0A0F8H047_METMZ|nr:hypothetical protein [Methanosarcina mazei]KKG71002.1 hypothetical protein DU63_05855 [Methanosarcina mazei]
MYPIDVFKGTSEEINEVPIDYFLGVIAEKTGWKEDEFLYNKDMGDLEEKIKVRAIIPIQTNSTKLGKSTNPLYRFVSEEERMDIKKAVDEAIKN